MSHFPIVKAFKELGPIGIFKKLYKMRTIKFGNLVGTDIHGNKYYENSVDYPYGQHRWVEFAGDKSFYQVDPSWVPPEWHLWLHSTTDSVPTQVCILFRFTFDLIAFFIHFCFFFVFSRPLLEIQASINPQN
jgi:NADH ubiquinone oxidoreductase subunit NDUFA12